MTSFIQAMIGAGIAVRPGFFNRGWLEIDSLADYEAYNGLAPENVFFVADNANTTVAQGYLVQTYHPYLFPERPINLYLNLASKGPGLDMLMGALLAR